MSEAVPGGEGQNLWSRQGTAGPDRSSESVGARHSVRQSMWRSTGSGRSARASSAPRSQLFALAYNLANFLCSIALPNEVAHWSLTTLREKLVKIGARIVRHGRYMIFQLAEVAVPRALFAAILRRIDCLRGPSVVA
jgi:hypothetical protein